MKTSKGVTLVELMVTVAIVSIVVLAIGGVLADSQKGYEQMWMRTQEGPSADAYVIQTMFERAARYASAKQVDFGTTLMRLYSYSDPNAAMAGVIDRYTTFNADASSGDLSMSVGNVVSGAVQDPTSTTILSNDVNDVDFRVDGARVTMVLNLDDGQVDRVVTASVVRRND